MSGTIRQDIIAYLRTRTAFVSYITSADSTIRLFLSRVPKSNPPLANFPCVVMRRSSGEHRHDLDGSAGIAFPLFEFHVMGIDPEIVETICEELRLSLQGYRGAMGASTVQKSTLEEEVDDAIETKIGDDVFIYRTTCMYSIGHLEDKPTF